MTIVARADGEPAALTPVLRAAVAAEDADVPLYDVATMERIVWQDLADTRVLVQVLTLFSASALLLAVVGIAGVLAQTVSQRVPEIGLRMALGATATEVARLVLRQTLASVAGGLVLGLAASAALARLVTSVLYGVSPTDPRTYLLVVATFAGAAVLAAVVPTVRAVRVDPLTALRT
jgi:ABC-type antimicrobial peptide transport system permease subunit